MNRFKTIRFFTFSAVAGILFFSTGTISEAGKTNDPGLKGKKNVTYYVATNGNDKWSGNQSKPNLSKSDGPFATIQRARDEIRRIKKKGIPEGNIVVEIIEGRYEISAPVEFTAEDSGNSDFSVTYRAYKGGKVRLSGGKTISGWKSVTDPGVLKNLDPAARGKVFQADLKAAGVFEYGDPGLDAAWELQEYLARTDNQGEDWIGNAMASKEYTRNGRKIPPRLDLYFNDEPMEISHWPNEGFDRIANVLGESELNVRGVIGCREGIFMYDGDRPNRWLKEKDPFVKGYWFRDWEFQCHRIASIDTIKKIISVQQPYHYYGYRKGQWFCGLNMLCELDIPGEFYIDRDSGILYFWPPDPLNNAQVEVSVSQGFFTLTNASNIIIQGFLFEVARGTAISMKESDKCNVVACTFRNMGNHAVTVFNGRQCGVTGCDIYNMGGGGIYLIGGDRKALISAEHYAENNHIHHNGLWDRTYRPAIFMSGVGLRASHNLIHDAPHAAILFGGMENVIEYNEIYNVCFESNDAGAVYAGRNVTLRGTKIRYNYLHDISGFEGKGCVGIYLDDSFSSADVTGNVFRNVTEAVKIGGGRDNNVLNNIFVDCAPSIEVDARGLGWMADLPKRWLAEAAEKGTITGIAYNKPPYSTKYPELINITNEEIAAPRGNVISLNVCFGGFWDKPSGFWKNSIEKKSRPYLKMENNIVGPNSQVEDSLSKSFIVTDPLFIHRNDPEESKYQLAAESPALKYGFKQIPFEKIGLYKSDNRTTW